MTSSESFSVRRFLVTGGCGFIGSTFIRTVLDGDPEASVLNLDLMTYAAHPETARALAEAYPGRYRALKADIADVDWDRVLAEVAFDVVVNFAAETHVDRSILDPAAFVRTNVVGVQNLLSAARRAAVRLVHVSTDEVYGSLEPGEATFVEESPLKPSSPYAASKAAADLLVLAAHHTHGQDVVITRCTNNFGPYQFPEKLIPLVIANALEDRKIPVYGDGMQIRDWLFVEDHCRAIAEICRHGRSGAVYNISGNQEVANIQIITEILSLLDKPITLIEYVADRPGHDRRYGLDASRLADELGWRPSVALKDGLRRTVDWYVENRPWWGALRDEKYFDFYRKNYRSATIATPGEPQ